MTVESAPFYWLVCDEPTCGERCPNDNDDAIAYADEQSAVVVAEDSDWLIVNGKHFCWNHAFNYCDECGERLTEDETDTGDRTCFKCSPVDEAREEV